MARLYGPGPNDPPPLVATRDLAGLSTTDVEARPVGLLYGALSEETTGLIRYLDVALSKEARHVLVPIGHARLDTDGAQPACRLRAATYEDLLAVPPYDPDRTEVGVEYQDAVVQAHGQLFYGANYYAHPAFDHGGLYAGESPIIDLEDESDPSPLRPLSELTGAAARSERRALVGAAVEDASGERVGGVADLLIETASGQPRYAVIELDEPPRRTVLPLGFLVPARASELLATRGLVLPDIQTLPPYEGVMTRAEENRLRAALDGRLRGDRYFQRPDFRRG